VTNLELILLVIADWYKNINENGVSYAMFFDRPREDYEFR